MTTQRENQNLGMFSISYRISNNLIGGICFNLSLLVSPPNRKLTGAGNIFQATSPPMDIFTQLTGEYTYMCVMPQKCSILLVLNGRDHQGNENVRLRIVCGENWRTGTASLEYLRNGKWTVTENCKVERVEHNDISDLRIPEGIMENSVNS